MYCGNCGNQIDDKSTFCMHCGVKVAEYANNALEIKHDNEQKENIAYVPKGESYFDGNTWQLIGYRIAFAFLFAITLGIAYPWLLCMMQNWKTKHTVIQGRRLKFDGRGHQLIGKYLLWVFLTIITLGIYGIWLGLGMKKWVAKHTFYADSANPAESYFSGGAGGYLGIRVLYFILTIFTLGIGKAWADKMVLKWDAEHTHIGGNTLEFDGTGGQLFVKYLLLVLLTPLTLGIYALCFPVNYLKWQVKHTGTLYRTPGIRTGTAYKASEIHMGAGESGGPSKGFLITLGVVVAIWVLFMGFIYGFCDMAIGDVYDFFKMFPIGGRVESEADARGEAGFAEETGIPQTVDTMDADIDEIIIRSWTSDADIDEAIIGNWTSYTIDAGEYGDTLFRNTFTFRSDGTYRETWLGFLCIEPERYEDVDLDTCTFYDGRYWSGASGLAWWEGEYTFTDTNRLVLDIYDAAYEMEDSFAVRYVEVNGDTLKLYDEWGDFLTAYTKSTEEY